MSNLAFSMGCAKIVADADAAKSRRAVLPLPMQVDITAPASEEGRS